MSVIQLTAPVSHSVVLSPFQKPSLRPVRLQVRKRVSIHHGNTEEPTDSQQARLDLLWWIARKGKKCRDGSGGSLWSAVEMETHAPVPCVAYAGNA